MRTPLAPFLPSSPLSCTPPLFPVLFPSLTSSSPPPLEIQPKTFRFCNEFQFLFFSNYFYLIYTKLSYLHIFNTLCSIYVLFMNRNIIAHWNIWLQNFVSLFLAGVLAQIIMVYFCYLFIYVFVAHSVKLYKNSRTLNSSCRGTIVCRQNLENRREIQTVVQRFSIDCLVGRFVDGENFAWLIDWLSAGFAKQVQGYRNPSQAQPRVS